MDGGAEDPDSPYEDDEDINDPLKDEDWNLLQPREAGALGSDSGGYLMALKICCGETARHGKAGRVHPSCQPGDLTG